MKTSAHSTARAITPLITSSLPHKLNGIPLITAGEPLLPRLYLSLLFSFTHLHFHFVFLTLFHSLVLLLPPYFSHYFSLHFVFPLILSIFFYSILFFLLRIISSIISILYRLYYILSYYILCAFILYSAIYILFTKIVTHCLQTFIFTLCLQTASFTLYIFPSIWIITAWCFHTLSSLWLSRCYGNSHLLALR